MAGCISQVISRFFAYDFDYQSLSLRISDGGVLPRRTKNPFVNTKKKKGKTRARNVGENKVDASESTKAKPVPVPKLEPQEHEKELRSNPEAELEASAQESVERLEQGVKPSEVVGTLEEGVTEVGLTSLECS